MRRLRAKQLSDSALEKLAQVTDADILASKSLFRSAVPARYRNLLDASLAGRQSDSRFLWDAARGRYVISGKTIQPLEIRNRVIEPLIRQAKINQRVLSAQLQNWEITLTEWQTAMTENIKRLELASALTANGGEQNTNENDKEEIAALILALLLLFRKFTNDIQRGRQALNGLLLARSDLYASSARGMYEDMTGYNERGYRGRTQERRLLGNLDHCHTDDELEGCVELAARGWQPIGSLPPIGKSPCRANCKCTKVYR